MAYAPPHDPEGGKNLFLRLRFYPYAIRVGRMQYAPTA